MCMSRGQPMLTFERAMYNTVPLCVAEEPGSGCGQAVGRHAGEREAVGGQKAVGSAA